MGLNIGITNDFLLNSSSVPAAQQKYILWAKARQGGSPGLKPSLDLDFARNKSLIDNVTGQNLVDFTRASSGTYVDSEGVIRTATTNLILWSENLQAGQWGVTGSGATITATTDFPAPNGTMTAWTLTSSGAFAQIQQAPAGISGATYTGSFWIRRRSGTGTVNIRVSENTNIPLVGVTSEWQRFSFAATSTSTTIRLGVNLSGTADAVDIWGAQLEQSTTVGEYIPTTSTINSAPRFDHRVTSSVTNLLLRSEEFDDAAWMKARVTVTANAVAAPDGTTTAEKMIANTENDTHFLFQGGSFVSGVEYVFSVFAKKEEWDFIRLGFPSNRFAGSGRSACFDLNNGTVGDTQSGVTASIVNFNNGWYRCSIKATANSTGASTTGVAFNPQSVDSAVSQSIAGDGTSGIYIWGAQLEQSSTVGEYVPTTTAAVTVNTTESLGLLVEEQRTNLLLRSEEFGTTWDVSNLIVAADTAETAAPNGAFTADKITGSSSSSNIKRVSQSVTLAATAYTFSVYAKAGDQNFLQMRTFTAFGDIYANFDIATGDVGTTSGVTSASIAAVGSGWYRCQIVFTPTAATSSLSLNFITALTSSSPQNTELTTSLYLWGAQLEVGAFPTSYIPTTTAAATRTADVASISGSNFSSWYRQDEGTVFAEAERPDASRPNTVVASITDGSGLNRTEVRSSSASNANARCEITALGLSQYSNATLASDTAYKKIALAYAADNVNSAANGNAGITDTVATIPVVSQLYIGNDRFLTDYRPGHVKRLTYWSARLPNETLQTITQ